MSAAATASKRMDDLQWPRALNKVITKRWSQLKNTLVMKDFVDYLIQKRVVTLDYWIGLKSRPISESERTEDFLALVLKFDEQKYNYFMEALLSIERHDLVQELIKAQSYKSKKPKTDEKELKEPKKPILTKKMTVTVEKSARIQEIESGKHKNGQTDAEQQPGEGASNSKEAHKTPLNHRKDNHQAEVTANLHKGVGNAEKPKTPERKMEESTPKPKKTVEFKDMPTTEEKHEDRPGTAKSKEEILEEKEKMLQNKENELSKKENELKEHEKSLKEKETELLTRENSLLTNKTGISDIGPLSLPAQLQHLRQAEWNPSASTTTSSELLADVREQLKAMKKNKEEIESEHTTRCSTPKEDFVRMQDFQNVQQNIDELKEEILSEREGRETVQRKVEDLKHEISTLQLTIKTLELQRETKSAEIDREINRLKTELKNSKSHYNETMNSLKMELKGKDKEISELKVNSEEMKKHSGDLERRIEILEIDKMKYEIELQRYEKEVSDLKHTLEQKENELKDLRSVLEETENEKEELIDELADLKNEVHRLKAEKKRLEAEKKTLLGRCVKPQWNQSSTGGSRRGSFMN